MRSVPSSGHGYLTYPSYGYAQNAANNTVGTYLSTLTSSASMNSNGALIGNNGTGSVSYTASSLTKGENTNGSTET